MIPVHAVFIGCSIVRLHTVFKSLTSVTDIMVSVDVVVACKYFIQATYFFPFQ